MKHATSNFLQTIKSAFVGSNTYVQDEASRQQHEDTNASGCDCHHDASSEIVQQTYMPGTMRQQGDRLTAAKNNQRNANANINTRMLIHRSTNSVKYKRLQTMQCCSQTGRQAHRFFHAQRSHALKHAHVNEDAKREAQASCSQSKHVRTHACAQKRTRIHARTDT